MDLYPDIFLQQLQTIGHSLLDAIGKTIRFQTADWVFYHGVGITPCAQVFGHDIGSMNECVGTDESAGDVPVFQR